jgi:hypothetical protein
MQDAQNQARQEAQNQAWQQAQGVQQQGFQQATGTALLPAQIMEPAMFPYQAGMAQQYNMQTLGQQQQYAKELAALENKYRLQQIRATPRGGGGGGPTTDPFQEYLNAQTMSRYAPQGAQTNPYATGAQGFAQGFGTMFVNQLGNKK